MSKSPTLTTAITIATPRLQHTAYIWTYMLKRVREINSHNSKFPSTAIDQAVWKSVFY
jgi:hypothetical protein